MTSASPPVSPSAGHRGDGLAVGKATVGSHASTMATPAGASPLSLFGVPLGLAGLGAGWSVAQSSLGASFWPEDLLYGIAAFLGVNLTTRYMLRGLRRAGTFCADLRHQIHGPLASFIPLVGISLATHYVPYLPGLGVWLASFSSEPSRS